MKRVVFAAGACAAAIRVRSAVGETVTPAGALTRLFTAPDPQDTWFTKLFLAQVPLDRVRRILGDLRGELGAYRSVAPNGKRFTVAFERGSVQADVDLDVNGAFAGLLISRMQSAAAADRLAAVFRTERLSAEWFSDSMLAQLPIDRIQAVADVMKEQLGTFTSAKPADDGSYDVTFAKGSATCLIFLGANDIIEGLICQPRQ